MSAGAEREAWIEAVKAVAADRGLTYEEVGGLTRATRRRRSAREGPTG